MSEKSEALKKELAKLTETMHEADQFHTLEEQIADMKRRGIDPRESYKKWDSDGDDWDDDDTDDSRDDN